MVVGSRVGVRPAGGVGGVVLCGDDGQKGSDGEVRRVVLSTLKVSSTPLLSRRMTCGIYLCVSVKMLAGVEQGRNTLHRWSFFTKRVRTQMNRLLFLGSVRKLTETQSRTEGD